MEYCPNCGGVHLDKDENNCWYCKDCGWQGTEEEAG